MPFKSLTALIIFLFSACSLMAQPVNDNCTSASFIHLPSNGYTCFVADNSGATGDGYFNTCDQGANFPLPAGGNEIWYTYIATGDSNFISISPITGVGAMVGPSVTVITGNCGALSTLVCDNPLPGTVAFNVTIGTQIWFYVTALTTDGKANVCIRSTHGTVDAGNYCNTATKICDKLSFTAHDPSTTNSGGLMAGCFNTPPLHTLWYQFTVGTSGTLEFTGIPQGAQGYFWALWDVTNGCGIGSITPVACNALYSPGQPFGLNDTVTSCSNSSFCPSVNVTAGSTYTLMIDDTTLSHGTFIIDWGGTFEMAPTSSYTISNQNICGYDSAIVKYTGNATSSALYNWDFGAASVTPLAQQTYQLNFPSQGNYIVSLQVAENNCVSAINSNQINVYPVPVASAGSDISFCSGTGPNQIGSITQPGYVYQWIDTVNLSNPDSSITLVTGINNTTLPTDITYYLVATQGLCHDTDDVKVTIDPRQDASILPASSQCFTGNSFTFHTITDTVPGTTFNWTFTGGTPSSSNDASPSGISFPAPGQYQVALVTQTTGCPPDSSMDTISVLTNPAVSMYSDISNGCPPLTVQLINTSPALPGGSYIWNTGYGTIDTTSVDTLTVTYINAGLYYPQLTLISSENCSTTDTIDTPIEVYPYADASFYFTPLEPTDLDPVVTFSNNELNGLCSYYFGDGDSSTECNSSHAFPDTGLYQVQLIVTSSNGCIDSAYRIIEVKKFFTLYIPNAFSPNHDGRNDLFVVTGEGIEDYNLRIFNRRGQMVFTSDNIGIYWNGSHRETGKQVPLGTYLYDLRVEDNNHKKHQFNGMVNVIR